MGKKALIVIDVQNDFIPGGSLPVKDGNQVIPVINALLQKDFDLKIASKDWHPADHESFAANHPGKRPGEVIDLYGVEQILWPVHCVQETQGAEFVKGLDDSHFDKIFFKGKERTVDSYSVFFDNGKKIATGLHKYLQKKGVTDLYLAGLATDYCVKFSAFDALELGYQTNVIVDGCRGVNLKPSDSIQALQEIESAGGRLLYLSNL